jgi:hypothetical protein
LFAAAYIPRIGRAVMNMSRWNSVNDAVRKRTLRQYAPLMDFVGCAFAPPSLLDSSVFHSFHFFQKSPVIFSEKSR